MRQIIEDFFGTYPDSFLLHAGSSRSQLDPDLVFRLDDYRDRQQFILGEAQFFRIDDEAEWMLAKLIEEMKSRGLDELYHTVRFPFPAVLIEKPPTDGSGVSILGLLTQEEGQIYTQRFIVSKEGIAPSMLVLQTKGSKGECLDTPTYECLKAFGNVENFEEKIEEEKKALIYLLAITVSMSLLLEHKGMLEVSEVSLIPRAERRRAAKSGEILPDTRISRIKLGPAGRGQVEAMREDRKRAEGEPIRKRTHWVRGHPMRSRSGEIVWRMPHLRGAGPLIKQERWIEAGPEEQD